MKHILGSCAFVGGLILLGCDYDYRNFYRLPIDFDESAADDNPLCGNGVVDVDAGEACDDGELSGEFGMCAPGCVLGPYCGDGIIAPEYEQCDDASHPCCSNSCKIRLSTACSDYNPTGNSR